MYLAATTRGPGAATIILMGKMTVVTGAAGFIGRNTVAELNRRGKTDLLLVDDLGTGEKWQNLNGLRYEDLIPVNEFLDRIHGVGAEELPEIDGIVHLGACSATTEKDADYLLTNNYGYTRTLAQWSQEHGARFVYASSAATYGDGSLGYDDDDSVTPKLEPLNMYGYSKHMFDLWALKNGFFANGHPIAGVKYFNVYGPYEDHKDDMRSVVHKSFGQIHDGDGKVKLFKSHRPEYKDGEQMRDFVYVKDAVDVTLWLLENPQIGGVFNCGAGISRTWNDLVTAVYAASGKKPNIEYVDMPETLREKYQYYTEAKPDKLRAAGYTKPFTTLEDGIHDYVKGYLEPRAEKLKG
ncbi:ADP-glyceromanno-heptose 6-epimerase [Terriglobus sp. TAA 43]|uniref:ADP-glyceromanno-heptose 6-epimerase n=1 Tax=Terriglobus sp. TAA 43 TaxID=278961 RepID=UPI001E324DCA|nr:ADP-glyceromanno-heptose 6-epimerase [Terriglobus sp. TAA 43]